MTYNVKKFVEILTKLAMPVTALATAINPIAGAAIGLVSAVATLNLKEAKAKSETINNEVTKMLEGKKTYIGLAVAGIALLAQMFGFEITMADQAALNDLILQGVGFAGVLLGIYGRAKASKK